MLYYLSQLHGEIPFLNLFRYITFRSGGAILTALLVAFVAGPRLIDWLRSKQGAGQPIREDGPESHLLTKKGTPTMGGTMILLALSVSTLLWADLRVSTMWAVLFVTLGYGLLGLADDLLKVTKRNTKGVPGKVKMLVQFVVGGIGTVWILYYSGGPIDTSLTVPFLKSVGFEIGWLYITDGLDGLATVPVMIATAVYGLIAYLVGNGVYAHYLDLHYVAGTGELSVFCGALIGAGLGFLWFNAPPAMVFMGDTGSLALGGALGAIALVTRHEIVLVMVGGLFVLETVSVIVQVASYKLTGKRVFRMAPLHHHYEKKGWAEPTIVIRFWIISVVLGLLGLATLKLR